MVHYGDLQFAERIMVARRSEISAEWKVRFAICIASVAIQAFTKLLFSFSDILKTTNCTFQEVDNIFCLAVGIAVYDELFSCMCALDVFACHTSSRITFLTLTIVGRSRGDVSPIVYSYYCYCTFLNLYVGFPFFYACSFICASSGSFVLYMDRQKHFFLNLKSRCIVSRFYSIRH